jgi:predicted metalloprotease with PDZ domain
MVKRAGIMTDKALLSSFDKNITAFENGPGKNFQSLTQASYFTWQDGPFGTAGPDKNKSISYYDKGPIVGLLLDFCIRHNTNNQKSLDNVMQYLYKTFYMFQFFTLVPYEQNIKLKISKGIILYDIEWNQINQLPLNIFKSPKSIKKNMAKTPYY